MCSSSHFRQPDFFCKFCFAVICFFPGGFRGGRGGGGRGGGFGGRGGGFGGGRGGGFRGGRGGGGGRGFRGSSFFSLLQIVLCLSSCEGTHSLLFPCRWEMIWPTFSGVTVPFQSSSLLYQLLFCWTLNMDIASLCRSRVDFLFLFYFCTSLEWVMDLHDLYLKRFICMLVM